MDRKFWGLKRSMKRFLFFAVFSAVAVVWIMACFGVGPDDATESSSATYEVNEDLGILHERRLWPPFILRPEDEDSNVLKTPRPEWIPPIRLYPHRGGTGILR